MFEHKSEPLLARPDFLKRMFRHSLFSILLLLFSLLVGVLGYRFTEGMSWIDSLLNASMILSGMGPANNLSAEASKLFASFYALFSGIIFISSASILVAPFVHRMMHSFHADIE